MQGRAENFRILGALFPRAKRENFLSAPHIFSLYYAWLIEKVEKKTITNRDVRNFANSMIRYYLRKISNHVNSST